VDLKKGAQMFKASAERGVAPAQLRLARCYAQGVGVEKSEADAAKWYLIAKGTGLEDPALEKMLAALPAAERTRAQYAAETWVQQVQLGGWAE
jgi:TPR repeat protein